MTNAQFKTIARLLKTAYADLEVQANKEGIPITSEKFLALQDKLRSGILAKEGFTISEYAQAKQDHLDAENAKKTDISQVLDKVTQLKGDKGEPGKDAIPPTKEELIALIKPLIPEPIHGKTPTKEEILVLLKPLIPKPAKNGDTPSDEKLLSLIEPLIPNIDLTPIADTLAEVKDKVDNLEIPTWPEIQKAINQGINKFGDNFKHNIDMYRMPDFRKLAMGLQDQIDQIKNSDMTVSLANGKIWIGNGSNQAIANTISGDGTISNTGVLTVSNTANITTSATSDNASYNLIFTEANPGSVPAQYSTGITVNPSTNVLSATIFNATTGFQIGGAAAAGTILRANGTNYIASTMTYPDTITANYVPYATGTNALGSSANLQFNGSTLAVSFSDATGGVVGLTDTNTNSSTTAAYAGLNLSTQAGTVTGGLVLSPTAGSLLSGGGAVLRTITAHPLVFQTNSTERARFLSTGELIVGDTAASGGEQIRLVKNNNGGASYSAINTTAGTGAFTGYYSSLTTNMSSNWAFSGVLSTSYTTSGIFVQGSNVIASSMTAGMDIGTRGASKLAFWTNNTEKMRLLSTGELVLGATSLAASTDVANFIKAQNAASIIRVNNATAGTASEAGYYASSDVASAQFVTTSSLYTPAGVIGSSEGALLASTNLSISAYGATGIIKFSTGSNGTFAETARLSNVGNFMIGGTVNRGTTVGTNAIQLFNGTAPSGTLTNGISLYSSGGYGMLLNAAGVGGNILASSAVNVVSPTSPNRTISVDIGGTTYYIAAKTTND